MSTGFERAMILHQQRRFADAERELKQVLAGEPHNANAHAMLGLCLAERRQFAEASAEADAAVGLAPDFSFAHYVRARVLNERNRFEEAEVAVTEALRLDPFNAQYYALLANVRFGQRRWPSALEAAENGLSIDPEHSGCVNLRAMALVKLGRKAEAGAAIGGALARDPHNGVTHANQGWALLHQGLHKPALEHFREALRIDPELEWARAGMVEALQARYLVYRWMLRYFLAMSRLSRRAQWGIVIGAYLAFQLLNGVAQSYPAIRPIVWPLLIGYTLFAYLSWTAGPLFNLLLRVNRFGRYALSREQTVASNWVGAALLGAMASIVVWALRVQLVWLLAAVFFVLMVIPISAVFKCPQGWPRRVMSAYAIGMAAVGAAALVLAFNVSAIGDARYESARAFAMAFLLGLVLQGWVGNLLLSVRVKH